MDEEAADDGEVQQAVRRVDESEASDEVESEEADRFEPEAPDGLESEDSDGFEPAVRRVDDADGRADNGAEEGAAGVSAEDDAPGVEAPANVDAGPEGADAATADVPRDVREYTRFSKIDGATYDRANEFLRDRTYVTAREWAIARLCADFRTETGVEMTKIGENLPHLVPFMTDTYSPQAVNQARSAFEDKVRKAGATFLYGAMCDFFTAEELDDLMYEVTEVAKFLLEVEGVELTVEEELEAEDRISGVMREVRESSAALRNDEVTCPECGHTHGVDADSEVEAATDGGTTGAARRRAQDDHATTDAPETNDED